MTHHAHFKHRTLVEALAAAQTVNRGITFCEKRADRFVAYARLRQNALSLLAGMQARGVRPGNEMVLQLADNQEFLTAFWACLLGGILPVPLSVGTAEGTKAKLYKVWPLLQNSFLICRSETGRRILEFGQRAGEHGLADRIATQTLLFEEWDAVQGGGTVFEAGARDPAFIQFSSGSTGDPKGVVLTHENLLTNIDDIVTAAAITDRDRTLSWTPLTHDLGLIGFHLVPLAVGIPQCILPTLEFITNPLAWFDKATQHGATILCSPNFGYKHFLNFFETGTQKAWDLSAVRLVLNGAEPISVKLSESFFQSMQRWGLKSQTAFPVYGLAEACVAVTFPPPGEGLQSLTVDRRHLQINQSIRILEAEDSRGICFADVGWPLDHCRVRICGQENRVLAAEQMGRIQIRGANVTGGYYHNERAFRAVQTDDGWLNTGDLGFMRQGRLIVTGREKEIIFINGINYYPADIEEIAAEYPGVAIGRIATCGCPDPQTESEALVVFLLFKGPLEKFADLARGLKKHINQKLGLEVEEVLPLKKLPKTTSGKLQRHRLREAFQAGVYDDIRQRLRELEQSLAREDEREGAAFSDLEKSIQTLWTAVLGDRGKNPDDSFWESGGTSLKAARFAAEIQTQLHLPATIETIFEYPTIRALARQLNRADATLETRQPARLMQTDAPRMMEMTPAQKRIFILNQMDPEDGSYQIVKVLEIKGTVEPRRLERALQALMGRHAILRTKFRKVNDRFEQVVQDEARFALQEVGIGDQPLESAFDRRFETFALDRAPLMAATLLKHGPEKFYLLVNIHHIICDGTSLALLVGELASLYAEEPVAEAEIQFRDYIPWHRRYLASIYERAEAFWLRIFSGELPVLDIPADHERPLMRGSRGDHYFFSIEGDLLRRVNLFLEKEQTTIFMFFLAHYFLLLHKYTGQEDIIVGVPVEGRSHPEAREMIGMFVNTIALRGFPSSEKTVIDFLAEIKAMVPAALRHQDYPFENLLEKLEVTRDPGRNPLFDTMLVVQNFDIPMIRNKDWTVRQYPYAPKTAKFDLTIFMQPLPDRLEIDMEYCTDLFEQPSIRRMTGHFLTLLEGVLENPGKTIGHLDILTAEEKEAFLQSGNQSKIEYPPSATLPELLSGQVPSQPGQAAILDGERTWSYAQLGKQSDALARRLRQAGVRRGSPVALCMERSAEFVLAVLAILKAGGAYVPIDPAYPRERIQYILQDCQPPLIVQNGRPESGAEFGIPTLWLNSMREEGGVAGGMVGEMPDPEDPAYILYTSGTTGKPKGVVITRRALSHYVAWAAKTYVGTEPGCFAFYTSTAFDLSVTSLFVPLVSGNPLIVYRDDAEEFSLQKVSRDNRIDILKATPAHLELLAEGVQPGTRIKKIIVGGEQLESGLAAKVLQRLGPGIKIYNEYGPTEATVGCMIHEYDPQKDRGSAVPIGVPSEDTKIYILDQKQRLVPALVRGEIYIGGIGLAQGYLNRPELTAEKFVPDSFSPEPGARLYRTGDAARRLADGNLEYLGRLDEQVKIRGFRVEPGEIENALLRYPGLQQCHVAVRQDDQNRKFLCAYFRASQKCRPEEIREYLEQRLPEHMIPMYFLQLEALPLTANGKVNKNALPLPRPENAGGKTDGAPQTALEEILAQAWREILGLEHIGREDNFFALGGDSIKAIQIAGRLQQEGLLMHAKDLLSHPTISRLCSRVRVADREFEPEQGMASGHFGLLPMHRWFQAQHFKNPHFYNQSVLLRLKKPLERIPFEQAWALVVEHHDGLRLNYDQDRDRLFYNNRHLEQMSRIEIFDLNAFPAAEQPKKMQNICRDLRSHFTLGSTLLIRCGYFVCSEGEHCLFITAHHFIMDGVSWRILLQDLFNAYGALASGRTPVLPSKTASLKMWQAKLQTVQKNLPGASAGASVDFGVYRREVPPGDRSHRVPRVEEQCEYTFTLNAEATAALRKHANPHVDILIFLLTALERAVEQWSGSGETVFEMESHGRVLEEPDVSRTIGWFTVLFPVRLATAKQKPEERLKEIKEQYRAATARALDRFLLHYGRKDLPSHPAPGIRFNYLGVFDEEGENEYYRYDPRSFGRESADDNVLTTQLDIQCLIAGGRLLGRILYSGAWFKPDRMEVLGSAFQSELLQLIRQASYNESDYFAPSDFDLPEMGQEALDALFG